jgi:integrase
MEISQLLNSNRLPRKQKGEIIGTKRSWFVRFYHTAEDGSRKQKAVKLADKSDAFRSKSDVEPLAARVLEAVNTGTEILTGQIPLSDFVETHYLPWCRENKSAPTANAYTRVWERYWKPYLGSIKLNSLQTSLVTGVLTKHAKDGKGGRTLSHIKWMLSGAYVSAVASGIVSRNPVPDAKWQCKVARPKKQTEYSLNSILAMLRILEPLDLRAAVALALAYFAALRPAEIRGLRWEDYDGAEVNVKRTIWRDKIGETKTEESAASVPVIEPLRGLLERLRAQSPDGSILQSSTGRPLSLDSLNCRVIAPAMQKAGLVWKGYYPCRRGISSLVTDTSKNALNSTGLLRHSTPITALKHYTRAQKDSIAAALKTVEEMATKPEIQETIQ